MKKYLQRKHIIIGKIDHNHPQSGEIKKSLEENFAITSKMLKDITSYTNTKRN